MIDENQTARAIRMACLRLAQDAEQSNILSNTTPTADVVARAKAYAEFVEGAAK